MSRRLKQAAVVFVVVIAAAQLVRPEHVETICAAARQVQTNTAQQR